MLFMYAAMIDDEVDQLRFADIYHGYRKQMLLVAKRVLNNNEDAEDAVQAAFLGIAQRIKSVPSDLWRSFRIFLIMKIQNTQRKTWHYTNTAIKRVALIAIIAALLATTAMAIPAIREAIIRFFLHDEGTHYEFSFDPEQAANAPDCIETVYYPTYIPSGYQLVFNTTTVASVSVGWSNSDDWYICYDQLPMPDDPENSTAGRLNSEGATTSSLVLNGYEVIRIEDENAIYYVWTNQEYMFDLICEKILPEEEIVKIFNSVQADPDAIIDGAD